MHGHGSGGPKDVWAHNVEATASLLIAFGTLITTCSDQGLFIPSPASRWILEYLVPFQLPIFYFCLGFLYQRYRTTRTPRAWGQNLRRELALMGIPFVAFTVLVLLTNSIVGAKPPLSGADLFRALLIDPVIPVGYFYTCLIIYAITPTVKSRRNASGLLLAALAAESGHRGARFTARHRRSRRAPPLRRHLRGRELDLGCRRHGHGALPGPAPRARIRESLGPRRPVGGHQRDRLLRRLDRRDVPRRSGRARRAVGGLPVLHRVPQRAAEPLYGFVTRYTMAIWLFHGICLALYFHLWKVAGISVAAAPWMAAAGAALVCYGMPVLIMAALSRLGKAGIIVYPARYLPPAPAAMLRKTPH